MEIDRHSNCYGFLNMISETTNQKPCRPPSRIGPTPRSSATSTGASPPALGAKNVSAV